ncbi:alpha/beta fold hydrolase [Cellulomonas soli]
MTTVDSSTLLLDGPWQHRFVPANGARFHVAVAGPDDRDTPLVVLLHGVPQLWWAWRHQIPELAAAGYRVAAMDVRGTGSSDKPPQGYDCPTLAADVAGVIRSLGSERAVVIGAGTGGDIAWTLTGTHPQVLHGVGVLAAPHPIDQHTARARAVRVRALPRLAFAQLPSFPERAMTDGTLVTRMLTEWGGAPGWLDAATTETYRRAARVPFAAHSQLEQLRWLARSPVRPDGRRHLATLRTAPPLPVLQVHGGRDGLRPARTAPLSAQTRAMVGADYRFELVPQAGHFLSDEVPEHVTRLLLDWLAGLELLPPA